MFSNGEILLAGRPDRVVAYPLRVESLCELNGGTEKKEKLVLKALSESGRNDRSLNMVAKEVSVLGFNNREKYGYLTNTEVYFNNWMMLRKAGIPTLPTVRVIDKRRVLITDMTSDGSEFFGKVTEIDEISVENLTDAELVFSYLDLSRVRDELERVERLAIQNNIALPIDDPFDLLVHPDGTWEVIVLDFGWAEEREVTIDLSESTSFWWTIKRLQNAYREKIEQSIS